MWFLGNSPMSENLLSYPPSSIGLKQSSIRLIKLNKVLVFLIQKDKFIH